jgi:hypothetical protein
MPGTVPAAPKNAGCFSKNYASIPLSTIGHLTLPKARSLLSEWGSMFISKTSAAPSGKLCCPCKPL